MAFHLPLTSEEWLQQFDAKPGCSVKQPPKRYTSDWSIIDRYFHRIVLFFPILMGVPPPTSSGVRKSGWTGWILWFSRGPPRHMYKHEGSYYLMAAEGGTGVNHSVVIAIGVLFVWVVGSAVNGSHRMSIEKLESWKFQEQWGTMGNMESILSSNIFVLFLGGFCWGDVQSTCMALVFSMSGKRVFCWKNPMGHAFTVNLATPVLWWAHFLRPPSCGISTSNQQCQYSLVRPRRESHWPLLSQRSQSNPDIEKSLLWQLGAQHRAWRFVSAAGW